MTHDVTDYSEEQSDQRAPVILDRVVVDVPNPEQTPTNLSEKEVLLKVQKRHHAKARRLLRELKNNTDIFTFDGTGQIYIDGKIQPINIQDCLSETFYHNKALSVPNFGRWIELLERLNLKKHITNPKYSEKKVSSINTENWYYLSLLKYY